MLLRKIAVAIPALNEAERIAACLSAILRQRRGACVSSIGIFVLANNCADQTAGIIRAQFPEDCVQLREVSLIKPHDHAGWARRLSIECAAQTLVKPTDVLMCTDADTIVAEDWVVRNLAHLDKGFDAVAGFALPHFPEWQQLEPAHRVRFNRLRKYHTLLAYLRSARHANSHDPWPRHEYEGGASIAMTLGMYQRISELPTPPIGEDKAVFEAVRKVGGRIRHPRDVRAFTSCRYDGRASGGMADTIALWGKQHEDAPIHGAWPLNVELGHTAQAKSGALTFRTLDREIAKARLLVRSKRVLRRLSMPA